MNILKITLVGCITIILSFCLIFAFYLGMDVIVYQSAIGDIYLTPLILSIVCFLFFSYVIGQAIINIEE